MPATPSNGESQLGLLPAREWLLWEATIKQLNDETGFPLTTRQKFATGVFEYRPLSPYVFSTDCIEIRLSHEIERQGSPADNKILAITVIKQLCDVSFGMVATRQSLEHSAKSDCSKWLSLMVDTQRVVVPCCNYLAGQILTEQSKLAFEDQLLPKTYDRVPDILKLYRDEINKINTERDDLVVKYADLGLKNLELKSRNHTLELRQAVWQREKDDMEKKLLEQKDGELKEKLDKMAAYIKEASDLLSSGSAVKRRRT